MRPVIISCAVTRAADIAGKSPAISATSAHTDRRRAIEVAIAIRSKTLNRMLELGHLEYVRLP